MYLLHRERFTSESACVQHGLHCAVTVNQQGKTRYTEMPGVFLEHKASFVCVF